MGKITSLEGQTVAKRDFQADPDKAAWHDAVDVLISPSTSGAAEVLAGAIGGNKRGDVIGERTFGTASEQKLIPLDDGGALVLTVAFYSTPDGKSIVEMGVTPTVERCTPSPPIRRPVPMQWILRRSVPASCPRRMIRYSGARSLQIKDNGYREWNAWINAKTGRFLVRASACAVSFTKY